MSKYIGDVSAYAYAVSKGYAGTEEEFAELMADYAEVGQRAEDAADSAEAALDEFTSVTADATTLPEGSSATAEYSDGHLTLGIPKGDKGDTGAKGDGAVYAVIGNTSSVIPVGTDGYLTSAYTITIPVTFYSGKDNVTGSVTSSDLYISRSSGGSGEMDTVRGSTYRNVQTATIIYAIPAGWRVGTGRITLTVTIGTVTLTYYHTYTIAQTGTQGEQGIQGPIGATPNLTIGTVTTLQPTAPATATITGTADNPVLSFGIPKGDTGEVSQAEFDEIAGDVSQLMSDLTAVAQKDDMLKAFPTDTASGAVVSFADGANVPVKSLIVNIDPVQEGTGDPSPDNVRPISGHAQAVVTRTGVNIWDEEWEVGGYAGSTGAAWDTNTRIRSKTTNYISVLPNTTYYVNMPSGTSMYLDIMFYNAGKTFISSTNPNAGTTFTTPSDARFMRFASGAAYGTTYNHDISINYPSTDHDYHPYSGQSINIQLGQTVYGGKLDVTNGVLTIDNGHKNKDNVRKEIYTLNGHPVWLMEYDTASIGSNEVSAISSVLKQGNYNGIYAGRSNIVAQNSQGRLIAIVDGISSVSDIDTWLNANPDFLVVYKLATPLIIQLTPNEVTALLGSNNVWADTGDSAVEYRADPTLYIGRLTEPDADMVADANITSGQYFMVGNTLYKATANIASGATISPNVNCTRKSLSEALNELNS